MKEKPTIGIIIPCYNEEEIIRSTVCKLLGLLDDYKSSLAISAGSFIGIVDDRSKDKSWQIIREIIAENKHVRAIRLASNLGHQHALLAGLLEFNDSADCLVSVDADLQDDMHTIGEMVKKFTEGNELVFGVRKSRKSDGLFKKMTALLYYRVLRMFYKQAIFNHADFRLTGRRVNEELRKYSEVNLFLRGLFTSMGFTTAIVYYDRQKRLAGKTKYPFRKMISLAFDGITSFSTVPLRIITFLGFFVFIICVILIVYAILGYYNKETIPGWFSTVLPFYFLGGIQILCIGILGEYLGKIYKEVKRRPRYIIDERING